ncbi:MAG: hypothetical protein COU07_03195 [Candidatus Harrisonbacteria bacterium CG10_big_fil_rev_8_21_14_0_10_40_38]|uniref:Glycosyltransferase n=1 Tax=Candidatus Harrisonbacteria bacterium CG10_big_fil_rev_8_21_14_0_10_40_38 TaxID=1974583 RepID=A0A2H0URM9_9BACT|nr:MAG: hypothetical protein COU07_03195 [Candidatus Harrisonbacteria bacterium CG10_big_fil_rev_8_21_14_0_10_40_38]
MKTKTKIAFIVNDLGLGGVQRLTIDFTRLLDKEKFETDVILLLDKPNAQFYTDELASHIKKHSFIFKGVFDTKNWFKLQRLLRREKYDVVITQLEFSDFIGRATAWLARVPVIMTIIQNLIPNSPIKQRLADRFLAKVTDVCISPTAAIHEYAKKDIGFPERKIIDIDTNGVDKERFETELDKNKFRKELNIPEQDTVVVNIGRLVEQKGQSVLIDAAKKILEKQKDFSFVIVGDGKLEDNLKKQAKELGIEQKVFFTGSRKDTPDILRSSDIFAFPSIWEGQGLILFEAIFSKIPIVASNTGGIPDIIKDNETGVLVEPGNSDELAKILMRVAEDKTLQNKITSCIYERYKHRTLQNTVKALEEAIVKSLDETK